MPKEIKMYESSDGKLFKTKKGAENHDKKIAVNEVLTKMNMTKEEIQSELERISERNVSVRMLLKYSDWTKWTIHQIRLINHKLFADPSKKTIFAYEYIRYGKTYFEEIATEVGEEFANPDKYNKHENEEYKVVRTEQVDDFTLKVYLDYKYTREERIAIKLKNKTNLSEDEIQFMVFNLDEVYEEEGDEGRWEREMTTVVKLDDKKYAINWSRGLTESQDNYFYEQPYEVEVKEEEVVITRTVIIPV